MLYEGRPGVIGCTLELLQQVSNNVVGLCRVPDQDKPISKGGASGLQGNVTLGFHNSCISQSAAQQV